MFGNRGIVLPDEQNLKFMNDEKRLELEADVKNVVRKINAQREDLPNMNYGMILGGFKWRIDELGAKVQKYEAYCYKLRTKLLAEAEEARMNELIETLREGKPEDIFKQETLTMIYADGFKAGTIAEGSRQRLREVTA